MAATGLLRFPAFAKEFIGIIKDQQAHRAPVAPSLLNPEVRVEDAVLCLVIAVTLFILRVVLQRKVFDVLFKNFPPMIRSKLSENLFYSIYYTFVFAYFYFIVLPQSEWEMDLLSNDSNVVRQLLHPFPPRMVRAEHIYYSQSGGFYLSALTFLFLFDGRRSDFRELVLHHMVTIALMSVSYAYGYVRFGIVIIALHDIGDIFLYSAKFLHHLGLSGLDTAVFAVFAVTFYVTRLVMYSRLVHAIWVETLLTIIEEPSFNRWAMFYDTYLFHYVLFSVLLWTLLALHCFWFGLILKMIYREVFLGIKVSEDGDIRSDGEDEDDGPDEKDENDDFLEQKPKMS